MQDDKHDRVRIAINAHGIFFKKAVRREIESYRAIDVLDEEHPSSFSGQTAIDLLLEYPGRSSSHRFVLVVECKKAYVAHKKWIFFPDRTDSVKGAYLVNWARHTHILINPWRMDIPTYSDGVEVDTAKAEKSVEAAVKAASCDTIYDAASQVCRGFLGFIAVQTAQDGISHDHRALGGFLTVPVIITNAPLFACTNDFSEIDIATGNLDSELKLEDRPWLLYRHPCADIAEIGYRDFRTPKGKNSTPEERSVIYKEPVFVVNSTHMKDFFLKCPIFSMVARDESANKGSQRAPDPRGGSGAAEP